MNRSTTQRLGAASQDQSTPKAGSSSVKALAQMQCNASIHAPHTVRLLIDTPKSAADNSAGIFLLKQDHLYKPDRALGLTWAGHALSALNEVILEALVGTHLPGWQALMV